MTHIIGAVLILVVVVLGWWTQVLDLRNAELASALAVAQGRARDGVTCQELISAARRGDYVGTLQAATRVAERYRR